MKIFRLFIILVFFFVGCHKWEETTSITENPTDISELQISSDFDWRTSLNVAFYITNAEVGMIQISSADGKIIFHKGYYNGVANRYHIIVSIPLYLSSVLINGEIVEINSNIIEYELADNTSPLKALKAANSLSFDGENDYVEISNEPDEKIIDGYPFTFCAWIKTSGFSYEDEDMVIFSMANSDKSDSYYGIYIGEDENGAAVIRARNKSYKYVSGGSDLTDDEWHQVVGVFKKKNKRFLYVDGVLVASDTRKVDFKKQSVFNIGRWADKTPKYYFNGLIDEVQVWSKALSSSEVANYYETSPEGNESNLEAFWRLEEGSGSNIADQSGNGNSGIINGASWAGEGQGIGSDSGDLDGDGIQNIDDDYPEDAVRSFNNYFPASSYGTLAFEDLWPGRGDYDFNDLVIDYQFKTVTNSDNFITEVYANFIVRAIGASFKNGFGFQLPNGTISNGNINVTGYSVLGEYITLGSNGLESGQNFPTIIVLDNAFDILPRIGGEMGVNTDPDASVTPPDTVKVLMTVTHDTYTINDLNLVNFNPFIMVNQERGKEIHLANYSPTALVDAGYFGTSHDNSNIALNRYYKTSDNLPWAINVYESFAYPVEKTSIIFAHLKFSVWAESDGELFPDWYQDKVDYRAIDSIYTVNN